MVNLGLGGDDDMYKNLHHSLPYKKISWGSLLRGLLFVNFVREEEL